MLGRESSLTSDCGLIVTMKSVYTLTFSFFLTWITVGTARPLIGT